MTEAEEFAAFEAELGGNTSEADEFAAFDKELSAPSGNQEIPQWEGIPNSIIQGASASWGDELQSGILAGAGALDPRLKNTSFMDRYRGIKDSIRDRRKQYSEENPIVSTGAEIAGGMLPLAKGMQGLNTLGKMVVGGGYGAAESLGRSDTAGDITSKGLATDTAIGAAIPGVLDKTGDMVKGLYNKLISSSGDDVNDILNQLVKHTGQSKEEIISVAQKMGPQTSLADATGDLGVGFAQGARGSGDMKTLNIMQDNLKKINQGKARIKSVMRGATTVGEGKFHDSMESLIKSTKTNAEKNYGRALDGNHLQYTPELSKMVNDGGAIQQAWDRTIGRNTRFGATAPPKNDPTVLPSMRAVQEMKFDLDAEVRALRNSDDSVNRLQGRRLAKSRDEFLNETYKQHPDFKTANKAYAGDKALEDAMAQGQKDGLNRINVENQRKAISELTSGEKDAYLKGVMSDTYSNMGRTREEILSNINKFTSENSEKVMSDLVGKKSAKDILKRAKSEMRYREVDTKVRQGSQTEPREIAKKYFEGEGRIDKALNMLKGGSPTRLAVNMLTGQKRTKLDDVNEIAELLTKPGGTEEAIRRMGTIAPRGPRGNKSKNLQASLMALNPAFQEE